MPLHTSHSQKARAFSLMELLVVIAVIGILAALLLPMIAKCRMKAQGLQCLNNHRQLCLAWLMYVHDSNDNLPYASSTNSVWTPASADSETWCTGTMDFDPNNRSNWDPDEDIGRSPLLPYCKGNLKIWKCPADLSTVKVNNECLPRVRSMGMNLYLGGWAGTDGGYGRQVISYKIFRKHQQLSNPGYSQVFVFVDMRPDSIDMANFGVSMLGWPDHPLIYQFWDLPGFSHHNSAGFSFADGHSEMKAWRDPRTMPPINPNHRINDTFRCTNNADIAWLQDHATRPK